MESRSLFRDALERRARRLVRLVEMSAPEEIIGREIVLIMEAATGFCPEEVSEAMGVWLARLVRREAGFCPECDKPMDLFHPKCDDCNKGTDGEDDSIRFQSERG